MKHHHTDFACSQSRKTLQLIQYPEDFQFYYEKSINDSVDQMSPTSTCPSQRKFTYWESQISDKINENQEKEQTTKTVSFQSLEGNLLGLSLQKYGTTVSNHIKQCLGYDSEETLEFVHVKEFQGLDLQKQQFSNTLSKYYQSGKSTKNKNDLAITQNPTLLSFLEEITYMNYEEINFELILIINEIYSFKTCTKEEKTNAKEFFHTQSLTQQVHFINFKFLNDQIPHSKRHNCYIKFLEKIFQIVSEIYIHYKVFEQEQDQKVKHNAKPEMIRNELKLFSSQRDLCDSDDDGEDFMRMSYPHKKVKQFWNE